MYCPDILLQPCCNFRGCHSLGFLLVRVFSFKKMNENIEYLLAGSWLRLMRETPSAAEHFLFHLPNTFVVELARCLVEAKYPDSSTRQAWVFDHAASQFPYHQICMTFHKDGGVAKFVENFVTRHVHSVEQSADSDALFEEQEDDQVKLGMLQQQWYKIRCRQGSFDSLNGAMWRFLYRDVDLRSLCEFIHEEVESQYEGMVTHVKNYPQVVAIRSTPARRPVDHVRQMYNVTWGSFTSVSEVEIEGEVAFIRPWFLGYALGVRIIRRCEASGSLWFEGDGCAQPCSTTNSPTDKDTTGLPPVPLFSSMYTAKWKCANARDLGSPSLPAKNFKRCPGVFEGIVLYLRVHHTRLHPLMDLYRQDTDPILSSDIEDLYTLFTRFPTTLDWSRMRSRLDTYRSDLRRAGLIREAAALFHLSSIPADKKVESIFELRKDLMKISKSTCRTVYRHAKNAMQKLNTKVTNILRSLKAFPRVHVLWGRHVTQPFLHSISDVMESRENMRHRVESGIKVFSERFPHLMENVLVLNIECVRVSVRRFRETILYGTGWCYDEPQAPTDEEVAAQQVAETHYMAAPTKTESDSEGEWEDAGIEDFATYTAKYSRSESPSGKSNTTSAPRESRPLRFHFSTRRPSPLLCTLCPPNPQKDGQIIVMRLRLMEKRPSEDSLGFDKTLTALVQYLGECMNANDFLTVSDASSMYLMPMDLVSMESRSIASRGVPFFPWKTDPQTRQLYLEDGQKRALFKTCTRDFLLQDYASVLSAPSEPVLKGLYQYKSVTTNETKKRGRSKKTRHADFAAPIRAALGQVARKHVASYSTTTPRDALEKGIVRQSFAANDGLLVVPNAQQLLEYKGVGWIKKHCGIPCLEVMDLNVRRVCSDVLLYAGALGKKLSCYNHSKGSRRIHSHISWGFLAWHTLYGESILPECATWSAYESFVAESLLHPVLANVTRGQLWRVDMHGPAFDQTDCVSELVPPGNGCEEVSLENQEIHVLRNRLGRGLYVPRVLLNNRSGDEHRLLECAYWAFCDGAGTSSNARPMLDQISPISTMQTRVMKAKTLKAQSETPWRMIGTLEFDGEPFSDNVPLIAHSAAQLSTQVQECSNKLRLTSLDLFSPVILNASRSEGLVFDRAMLERDHREVVDFHPQLFFVYDLARGARGSLIHEMNGFLTRCTQSCAFTGTLAPMNKNISLATAKSAFELLNFIVHHADIAAEIPHFDFNKTKDRYERIKSDAEIIEQERHQTACSFLGTRIITCADFMTCGNEGSHVFDF